MTIFGPQTAIPKHRIDLGEHDSSLFKFSCMIARSSLSFAAVVDSVGGEWQCYNPFLFLDTMLTAARDSEVCQRVISSTF